MDKQAVYYNLKNKNQPVKKQPVSPPVRPKSGFGDKLMDSLKAIPAGFYEGLVGRNMTYEQWKNEKNRKRKGLAPSEYPGRGLVNWFQRVLRR